MQADDDHKDSNHHDWVHDVGETLTPKCLTVCAALIILGEEEMEEQHNSTLKLGATVSVDGCGEGHADDGLTNVGWAEKQDAEGDARAVGQVVKEDDNEGGRDELDDE